MTVHNLPEEILSQRLHLRKVTLDDCALIEHYVSDARVARMLSRAPHPYPKGAAEVYVRGLLAPESESRVWAIAMLSDRHDGLIGLIGLDPREGVYDLGYWLAPSFWGTGIMTEATAQVLQAARTAGFAAVTSGAFTDNPASNRVLEKSGFVYLEDTTQFSVARGEEVPIRRYRIDF